MPKLVKSEEFFLQKKNYIEQNPVRKSYVEFSEYWIYSSANENKLLDLEYTDSAKINAEDFHSAKANMSLLKELLKDREENKDQPKEKANIQSNEEQGTPSPLSKSTNPHPDPKRK